MKRKEMFPEATVRIALQKAVDAERERCANVALAIGIHYGEAAVGSAIANSIRATDSR